MTSRHSIPQEIQKKNLCQLVREATDKEIMDSDGPTLRLVNQKSGHKIFYINHENNGEPYLNPMKALGSQYVHLRNNTAKMDSLMSALFDKGNRSDIKNGVMSKALKLAAIKLSFQANKRIRDKGHKTPLPHS